MNYLPRDKQVEAISALVEGVSIRATARLTGIDRGGTIMNLGVVVGRGCAALHDTLMRDLRVNRIELWAAAGSADTELGVLWNRR